MGRDKIMENDLSRRRSKSRRRRCADYGLTYIDCFYFHLAAAVSIFGAPNSKRNTAPPCTYANYRYRRINSWNVVNTPLSGRHRERTPCTVQIRRVLELNVALRSTNFLLFSLRFRLYRQFPTYIARNSLFQPLR